MKILPILVLALAFSAPSIRAANESSPTPTPSVTPTPAPVPTIVLSDGHAYTAADIEQRIADLVSQRNTYVGQVLDLNNTVQRLQQQLLAKSAPPATPPKT